MANAQILPRPTTVQVAWFAAVGLDAPHESATGCDAPGRALQGPTEDLCPAICRELCPRRFRGEFMGKI